MTSDFKTLHQTHKGKITDKWQQYLSSYDAILSPYKNQKINLLEIGVQNGGSLEIWSKYFVDAQHIIGCDINPQCGDLVFDDSRIRVFVGDASQEETHQTILETSMSFDIIIDDGSHTSRDIIHNFALYFNNLRDGGVYIIEDLHCSYWQEFGGGLYHPYSAMAFLKSLVDVIHYEHWGLALDNHAVLREFYQYYGSDFSVDLSHIHSVEFINSICVIKKQPPTDNELGVRCVSGEVGLIFSKDNYPNRQKNKAVDQNSSPYKISQTVTIENLKKELSGVSAEILNQQQMIRIFQSDMNISQFALEEKSSLMVSLSDQLQNLNREFDYILSAVKKNQARLEDLSHIQKSRVQDLEVQNRTIEASLNATHQLSHMQAKRYQKYKSLWVVKLVKPLIKLEQGISSANVYRKGFYNLIKEKGSIGKAYQFLRRTRRAHGNKEVKTLLRSRTKHIHSEASVALSSLLRSSQTEFLFQVCKSPSEIFARKILIIAELSIPQCTKYRVTQKKEMFDLLGIDCKIVSWHEHEEAKKWISLSSLVIFYRVPGFDGVISLIDECKRLGVKSIWDVDDLIFDQRVLEESSTINSLAKKDRVPLINGAKLYRKAMLACDEGMASTAGLAAAMKDAGMSKVYVLENALDRETIAIANQNPLIKPSGSTDKVRIIYGSGTTTHNVDFEEAAPSIARILREREDVIFRVVGYLDLPKCFEGLEGKVERIGFCKYPEYLNFLAESDISIAPLETYIFNESKSNIKYLEASIMKVASVCSPLSAFKSVITHGINGLLAGNDDEWYAALMSLIDSSELRESMAKEAYRNVRDYYQPKAIAEGLADIFQVQSQNQPPSLRILSFNVYYRPRSFGGATIVAEQLNDLLAKDGDAEVYVVTTLPHMGFLRPYSVIRYEMEGATIFGICVPDHELGLYNNPNVDATVEEIIRLIKPDIAHIHSIQGLGVGVLDMCTKHKVKTAVTLHDAWWICPRQFMIQKDGLFCNQFILDKNKCMTCIGNKPEYLARESALQHSIQSADVLLAPSRYFADLYEANLCRQVLTNQNGVHFPQRSVRKFRGDILRFGYVGGNTNIKGVHLILESFRRNNFRNTQLILVDNMLNVGEKSYFDKDLVGIQNVEIFPAYDQNSIDEFFEGIDVLLFPTQWKESFGLTVREAISRNVWVIATDAGGVVEDIINGVNGTIIPFNSGVNELSEAIKNVCDVYFAIDREQEINLEKHHIKSFAEQKQQLLSVYNDLL